MAGTPRKTKQRAPNPFAKTPKVPKQVESSALLWLDFFMQYSLALIEQEPHEPHQVTIDRARAMADEALDTFQERWPKVEA